MIEFLKQKQLGKSLCSLEPMTMMALAGGAQAGGSIFSSIFGSKGAQESAAATRYAADKAAETALTMNQRAREDVAPFRQLGIESGDMISDIMAGRASLDDLFKSSSLFDVQSELGTRNLNRQLKARGLFGSGAGLETLAMFEKNLVAEEGNRWWDRLFNTTAMGSNAAAHMATGTTNTGNSIANMQAEMGKAESAAIASQYNAKAQGAQGVAGAVQDGLQNLMNYTLYKPVFDKMSGSSGGTSTYQRTDMDFNMASFNRD